MLFVATTVLMLVVALFLFRYSDSPPITNYPPKKEAVVAFGDSLVFGQGASEGNDFVSVLSRAIGRPIVNLGVPGDTTEDGLARADVALGENPGIVLILLGGNDYLRRVDEEITRANLGALIERFQDAGAVVVLLGVRSGILINGRDDMYEELSETYGTIYVEDVLDGIFGNANLMYDGIHPNDAGYRMIAERLADVFREYEL